MYYTDQCPLSLWFIWLDVIFLSEVFSDKSSSTLLVGLSFNSWIFLKINLLSVILLKRISWILWRWSMSKTTHYPFIQLYFLKLSSLNMALYVKKTNKFYVYFQFKNFKQIKVELFKIYSIIYRKFIRQLFSIDFCIIIF